MGRQKLKECFFLNLSACLELHYSIMYTVYSMFVVVYILPLAL